MSSSAQPRFVAVLDVGKTNVKVVLHDLTSGSDVISRSQPNAQRSDGPYPHADTENIFAFAIDSLADIARSAPVDAISITSHGACAAILGPDGLVLPVLDYEYDGPVETADAYDRIRPAFAESFSPRLPVGLNLGAQLFWQKRRFPAEFGKATHILAYPQYWAWRLSGVTASEATSLGCHTDLWAPMSQAFSSLVQGQGWSPLFPPLRRAFDVLGPLRPDLARQAGLPSAIPVHCGIHDSNASLLPHLLRETAPFAVVSTGTWVVCFAIPGTLEHLDAGRDTLANVDAFGRAVPSSRFMGGREFAQLTAGLPEAVASSAAEADLLQEVLRRQLMILPGVVPGSGPFPRGPGGWRNEAAATPAMRRIAASLYLALMTAACLELIGAAGPIMIEGPSARNTLFCQALAGLTGRVVRPCLDTTGTSAGAALLANKAIRPVAPAPVDGTDAAKPPIDRALLRAYAGRWRAEIARSGN